MLTCPNRCRIFPAPYRNGMLLSDPTVTVIPAMLHWYEKQEIAFFQEEFHIFTSPNQTVRVHGALEETEKGQHFFWYNQYQMLMLMCVCWFWEEYEINNSVSVFKAVKDHFIIIFNVICKKFVSSSNDSELHSGAQFIFWQGHWLVSQILHFSPQSLQANFTVVLQVAYSFLPLPL